MAGPGWHMEQAMKKSAFRWLINPLFLLSTVTYCEGVDLTGGSCRSGVDTDGDKLNDDIECALGTNASVRDSDGDGVSDGDEYAYPRICVAQDLGAQRRDPASGAAPGCTSDGECQPGETCRGLDPTKSDSDGDGVLDLQEDLEFNGVIEFSKAETDPRLYDTDGDGVSDKDSGAKLCRPEGLATVTRVPVPSSGVQLGHDPVFGTAKTATGATGSAVYVDDADTGVSGVVASKSTNRMTIADDATFHQNALSTGLSAVAGTTVTGILVNRPFATHEQYSAIASTYRVVRNGSNASTLRDEVIRILTGATVTSGAGVGTSTSNAYYLDITTVRRGDSRNDVLVALSPAPDYDDLTKQTAIRVNDLVNSTGVAETNKLLDAPCLAFKADRIPAVEFVWTVDVSGSMGPYQAALGRTADAFFKRLQSAGVDFRVGVFDAGNAGVNLVTPGFKFIDGTSLTGPLDLCRQVTAATLGSCPLDANDTVSPYQMTVNASSQREECTAAAVITHNVFKTNAAGGSTAPNQTLRKEALKVYFLVTDEPGSNDYTRYFQTTSNPDTQTAWGSTYNTTTLGNIVKYFKDNQILTFGYVPVDTTRNCSATINVADLPRCVIETNGGAAIPIRTTFVQAEIDAGMARIVEAVIGSASQFKLARSPITSTIKVNVNGVDVPRSRSSGFDYDPASKSIIFYGSQYRPMLGQSVTVSYRVWQGSIG